MLRAWVTTMHRDVRTHSTCQTRYRRTHASLPDRVLDSTVAVRHHPTPHQPLPLIRHTNKPHTPSLAYRPLRAIIQCKQGTVRNMTGVNCALVKPFKCYGMVWTADWLAVFKSSWEGWIDVTSHPRLRGLFIARGVYISASEADHNISVTGAVAPRRQVGEN